MRTIAGGAVGCGPSSVGHQPTPARECLRYVETHDAINVTSRAESLLNRLPRVLPREGSIPGFSG